MSKTLFLNNLSQESVQTFIIAAKKEGFSEEDIERGLNSRIQSCEDTFIFLKLFYDVDKQMLLDLERPNKAVNLERLTTYLQTSDITVITESDYYQLLDKYETSAFTKDDIGFFIMKPDRENVYIAIDNSTKDLWVEEYDTMFETMHYFK